MDGDFLVTVSGYWRVEERRTIERRTCRPVASEMKFIHSDGYSLNI